MELHNAPITIDRNTKILCILYSFFVPFFIIAQFDDFKTDKILLPCFIAFVICGFFTIKLLLEYSKFIFIDEEYFYLCLGKLEVKNGHLTKPKILERIALENIDSIKLEQGLDALNVPLTLYTKDNQKIPLLAWGPSLWVLILTVPFVTLLLLLKRNLNISRTRAQLKEYFSENQLNIITKNPKNNAINIILDIILWIIVLPVAFVGFVEFLRFSALFLIAVVSGLV